MKYIVCTRSTTVLMPASPSYVIAPTLQYRIPLYGPYWAHNGDQFPQFFLSFRFRLSICFVCTPSVDGRLVVVVPHKGNSASSQRGSGPSNSMEIPLNHKIYRLKAEPLDGTLSGCALLQFADQELEAIQSGAQEVAYHGVATRWCPPTKESAAERSKRRLTRAGVLKTKTKEGAPLKHHEKKALLQNFRDRSRTAEERIVQRRYRQLLLHSYGADDAPQIGQLLRASKSLVRSNTKSNDEKVNARYGTCGPGMERFNVNTANVLAPGQTNHYSDPSGLVGEAFMISADPRNPLVAYDNFNAKDAMQEHLQAEARRKTHFDHFSKKREEKDIGSPKREKIVSRSRQFMRRKTNRPSTSSARIGANSRKAGEEKWQHPSRPSRPKSSRKFRRRPRSTRKMRQHHRLMGEIQARLDNLDNDANPLVRQEDSAFLKLRPPQSARLAAERPWYALEQIGEAIWSLVPESTPKKPFKKIELEDVQKRKVEDNLADQINQVVVGAEAGKRYLEGPLSANHTPNSHMSTHRSPFDRLTDRLLSAELKGNLRTSVRRESAKLIGIKKRRESKLALEKKKHEPWQ